MSAYDWTAAQAALYESVVSAPALAGTTGRKSLHRGLGTGPRSRATRYTVRAAQAADHFRSNRKAIHGELQHQRLQGRTQDHARR